MIVVVIPYFQRQRGVLTRALASVAAQQNCPLPVHVIVVDDASPMPAAAELASVPMPAGFSTQLILQANAGPGAARNTGLDAAPVGTRYVAFLDSDDEWSTDHLSRAVSALQAGFDFYFADLIQLDATVGAFARAGRVVPDQHRMLVEAGAQLHAYQGDMLDQIIRGNVIGTSTVVYDLTRFGTARFRVEFARAGEDYLFWLDIAAAGARFAFSSRCEAVYGRGVNIFAGAGWGTEGHLQRIQDEIRFKKLLPQRYRLSQEQRQHVKVGLAGLRIAFTRDVLHRVSHRRRLPLGLLFAQWRVDPMTYAVLPVNILAVLHRRAQSRPQGTP